MRIALRPAHDDDATWLAELRAVVLADDLGRLGRFDPVRVRERFLGSFDAAATRVVVVDGVDRGSVAVRGEADARWLEHFYLDPAVQGVGVGSAVLERILAEADPRPFRLNVLQGSRARRLYERFGFTPTGEDAVDVYLERGAVRGRS
jgi:GNAT superfamily N-acetyltransferase